MNEKTYEQGKIDGQQEFIEKFNSFPPIIYSTPPLIFSDAQIEQLKLDIADNFQDLTDDDRTQILDYISSRFYYNNF